MLLTQDFFLQKTVTVAKELIGKELIFTKDNHKMGGIINETEAYTQEDKACHAYNGNITKRNKPMFKQGGCIYIYLIYGMYHCLNIVTEEEGRGCAVLIRGIIPSIGINKMKENRNMISTKNLTNGPGKLMMALQIPASLNEIKLSETCPLQIIDKKNNDLNIISTPRIGIRENKDVHWRFLLKEY